MSRPWPREGAPGRGKCKCKAWGTDEGVAGAEGRRAGAEAREGPGLDHRVRRKRFILRTRDVMVGL